MERDGQNGNREEIRKDGTIEKEEVKSETKTSRASQQAMEKERTSGKGRKRDGKRDSLYSSLSVLTFLFLWTCEAVL